MSYPFENISLTDPLDPKRYFQISLRAARRVPSDGSVNYLPPPFGNVTFLEIPEDRIPEAQRVDPLQALHPSIKVRHLVGYVPKEWLVLGENSSIPGVATYWDWNAGNMPAAIQIVDGGRFRYGPWDWDSHAGDNTTLWDANRPSPLGRAMLGSFPVITPDGAKQWVNYYPAGARRDLSDHNRGMLWSDGIPETFDGMYDPSKSPMVVQSVLVPKEIAGDAGVAQQSLPKGLFHDDLVVMVYPMSKAGRQAVGIKDTPVYRGDATRGGFLGGGDPESFGMTRGGFKGIGGGGGIEPHLRMCAGGRIKQHTPMELAWAPGVFPPVPALKVRIKLITDADLWGALQKNASTVTTPSGSKRFTV